VDHRCNSCEQNRLRLSCNVEECKPLPSSSRTDQMLCMSASNSWRYRAGRSSHAWSVSPRRTDATGQLHRYTTPLILMRASAHKYVQTAWDASDLPCTGKTLRAPGWYTAYQLRASCVPAVCQLCASCVPAVCNMERVRRPPCLHELAPFRALVRRACGVHAGAAALQLHVVEENSELQNSEPHPCNSFVTFSAQLTFTQLKQPRLRRNDTWGGGGDRCQTTDSRCRAGATYSLCRRRAQAEAVGRWLRVGILPLKTTNECRRRVRRGRGGGGERAANPGRGEAGWRHSRHRRPRAASVGPNTRTLDSRESVGSPYRQAVVFLG
jgi:hypothetical protein